MLKKKNILIAIVITIFFLTIASLTTFRIAIYAFVVCYIGVIIAKSQNKRLRVPVPDFFILTFFVGIILSFIYSYSPRLQYYEFVMLHARWEVNRVTEIKEKSSSPIQLNSNFHIGTSVSTDLYFIKDSIKFKKEHEFNFFIQNVLDIINQNKVSQELVSNELSSLNSELFLFKKPNKEVYKVFSKKSFFEKTDSASNLAFSFFFLIIYVIAILQLLIFPKRSISVLLNQYPKRDFLFLNVTILYILIYSIFTFIF